MQKSWWELTVTVSKDPEDLAMPSVNCILWNKWQQENMWIPQLSSYVEFLANFPSFPCSARC